MKLDMQAVTLGQLADASDILGGSITDALQSGQRERAILTLAFVVMRDEDPSFTIEDARKLRFSELEVVNADPETNARDIGDAPPLSRASGD